MPIHLVRSLYRPRALGTAAVIAALSVSAACSGTSNTANTKPPSDGGGASSPPAVSAELEAVYKGTLASPDATSRPAAKGKSVWVISGGQSSESSSVPVNAAVEAAKKLGWKVHIYDTQLNPANDATGVSQAIAANADGIILDAIDCSFVKSQLEQAKAKGIVTVPIYAYDCDDAYSGKGGSKLFSAYINYGPIAAKNLGAFAEKYGFAQGQAAIAATGGKAKVIFFNDTQVTVLHYTGAGFLRAIRGCSGCEIVKSIDFTGLQLGPQLQQMAAAALLQHPEANVVKSPFTAATLLSIGPAVVQSGHAGNLYVMGGEGFADELDLLRNHQGVNAVMISPSDWTGWAAVDTMNSLFQNKAPAYSGLGWQLVDATHNLPTSGAWVPPVDFKAIYAKAWGVS
ncbi:MAG: ribose transport system substrate-binding protein [Frankiaceae bacterium]|jgi:ribose transport system substrate-binding protein|nr:ribose transport system substrate-binding protein [Frankiaceae bacterium]